MKINIYIISILVSVQISCSSNISDTLSSSLSNTVIPNTDGPINTPGTGGSGTGGGCYVDPVLGRICSADPDDLYGDPNVPGIISVDLLNLNTTSELLRGGGEYYLKYRSNISYAKFKSVHSKIEYKKDSDQNWKLIADKIVSNDKEIVTYKWSLCPNENGQNCELDSNGSPVQVNGSDFKIRVTSYRILDQKGEASSNQNFTIDSERPTLTSYVNGSAGIQLITPSLSLGFVEFSILGASDNLTKIRKICYKTILSEPTISDPCWHPMKVFNPNYTGVLPNPIVMSSNPIPIFVGFSAKVNNNYYVWIMDEAGNVSQMALDSELLLAPEANKDVLIFSQSAASYTTQVWTGTPTFTFQADASASGSISRFETSISDLTQYMGDPNSFIVNSAGIAFVKHNQKIYSYNLKTGAVTVFLAQGTHATGSLSSTARVNDPIKIAFDHEENIWIMDKVNSTSVIISKINNPMNSPTLTDLIGSGTGDTTIVDELAPLSLNITYSDNLKWYGTFYPLPDGGLVFSDRDPTAHPISGVDANQSFYLRLYDPKRPTSLQLSKITLNSKDSLGSSIFTGWGNDVGNLVPYGGAAVTFNFTKNEIDKLYVRFCAPGFGTTCSELVYVEFDSKGNFQRILSNYEPWHFGNETLKIFGEKLYMMNFYQGTAAALDISSDSPQWSSLFSTSGRATSYCENGINSQICKIRNIDFFMLNNKLLFIDQNKIRFIDEDGSVQTYFTLN